MSLAAATGLDSVDPIESFDLDLAAALPAFKRCLCLGVTAGQSCKLCFNTHWLKRCESCGGGGILFKAARAGSEPVKERCGFCMGRGWLGAKPADVAAIQAQETTARAIRTAAEHKLSGAALEPAPEKTSRRGTGKSKSKTKTKTKKSTRSTVDAAIAATKPTGRGRGRQPSVESLARLAELTGQTLETPASISGAASLLD